MSGLSWLRPARWFSRRACLALLCGLLVGGVAILVNVACIRVVGSIEGWERWLRAHSVYFRMWRLLLYGATAFGWWRMRARLWQRELEAEMHGRLLRAEIATVVTIALLEASQLLRSS